MNAQQVRKLVKEATSDTIIVGDGLMLRFRGGQWTWNVRYRANGVRRRVGLGKYPRISLAAARTAASRLLRKVDTGEDPQASQRAARAAAERAKRDSIELVRAIADRPAPTQAIAVARLLSKLFNWALSEEWIETSPATRIIPRQRKDQDHETKQAYTPDEIRQIWKDTEKLPACERAPIRLGLLTGQRPTEISDMRWSELEGRHPNYGNWWRIPGARTKNGRPHRVYLTQPALDELAEVWQVVDQPYVFHTRRGPKQLGAINTKAFAGVREREKPRHALRHTVGTGMASIRISKDDRAKVLNHVDSSVTGIYDEYEYDKEKRLALSKWARRLQQILDATDEQKVVSIAR